jgi:hypothetical protein
MNKLLIPLLAGCAMAGAAFGITFTDDPYQHGDRYGVFWCQLLNELPAEKETPKTKAGETGKGAAGTAAEDEKPMKRPTKAQFNQKIILHVKDLGEWWTAMKADGLTEEKSLESFISRLVLIIDGVPLRHLQPSGAASETPTFPYHNDPYVELAPRNPKEDVDVWRKWFVENALRDAENHPSLESMEHVRSLGELQATVTVAAGAQKDAEKAGGTKEALDQARSAEREALPAALKAAEKLSNGDFDALEKAEQARDAAKLATKTGAPVEVATAAKTVAEEARQLAAEKQANAQLAQAKLDFWNSAGLASEAAKGWNWAAPGIPLPIEHPAEAQAIQARFDKFEAKPTIPAYSPADAAALGIPPIAGKGERYYRVTFMLVRKDEDQSAWVDILRPDGPSFDRQRRCRISLAFERKDGAVQEMVSWVRPPSAVAVENAGSRFFLVAMPDGMLRLFGGIFVFALVVLIFAGVSGLLREPDAPPRPDGAAPYSLGRCQMALWFFLISLAFVFLWQMLGRKDTINNTAVVLLGISSFTAVGSVLIGKTDGQRRLSRQELLKKCQEMAAPLQVLRAGLAKLRSDKTAAETALAQLERGRNELAGQLPLLEAKAPDPDPTVAESEKRALEEKRAAVSAKQKELAAKAAELAAVDKNIADGEAALAEDADRRQRLAYAGPLGIPGFFNDLLRDGDGRLSIARFQMMVWTLVLAIVFTVEVYSRLSMPEFNPSLLALLGITSGTYLGFKGATQIADRPK